MSRIEDELRSALRRHEPSPDFSDRVMARIAELPVESGREKSREKRSWLLRLAQFFHPVQVKWAMAGVVCCLMIFATFGVHRYREHQRSEIAEGERAKEQVMLAMKIASAKLNAAQKKVQESSEK
jgi:Predicted integral membrane protein (DUF2275)